MCGTLRRYRKHSTSDPLEALDGEYRGHARLVAQFVMASQALQGLAQSVCELAPRDVPNSAWWSCVASNASQLCVMSAPRSCCGCQNVDAEIPPTALHAGICAPVALLAARRFGRNVGHG
jgi:hypothetical protein